jgi:prokaryotic ubiquitin-like protein Pup
VEWLEEREEPVVPQEQEQKKIQKKIQNKSGGGSEEDARQVQSIAKGEKLKEEMGEILDEIDSVLEENAEEFVNSYIQKGGGVSDTSSDLPVGAGGPIRAVASGSFDTR